MILIIGTPDSGKSLYGETLAVSIFGEEKKAYIATMIPFGEDGLKRVEKHRQLRSGKGFITYEKPDAVEDLIAVFETDGIRNAMLECMSNLVGNEIYKEENSEKSDDDITRLIISQISSLDEYLDNLIVISNEFEFSEDYDQETIRYIKIANDVNEGLKRLSTKYIIKKDNEWDTYENT